MSQESLSSYVERCRKTLEEYSRLRELGVSHEMARRQSGFEEAVMGRPVSQAQQVRDVRKIIAGDEEA